MGLCTYLVKLLTLYLSAEKASAREADEAVVGKSEICINANFLVG